MVFVESMTDPTLRVINIVEIGRACRDLGCRFIVDNTFAKPYSFKSYKSLFTIYYYRLVFLIFAVLFI